MSLNFKTDLKNNLIFNYKSDKIYVKFIVNSHMVCIDFTRFIHKLIDAKAMFILIEFN